MDNREAQAVTFEQSGHKAVVHEKCDNYCCMICEGGLFACVHCGSFEGATTTHCPGGSMTADTADKVYAGELDYRDGEWVKAGSPHTPNRGWDLYPEPPVNKPTSAAVAVVPETAPEPVEHGYEQKEEGFEGLGPPPDGFVRVVIDYPVTHYPQINRRRDEEELKAWQEAMLREPYRLVMPPPTWWASVTNFETGRPCDGLLKQMIMSKDTAESLQGRIGHW